MSTHQPRTGLTHDPRFLAGAAGGLVSALAALWAFHGLPLGAILFWLAPLPLCLAGLGFGLPSFLIAVVVAGVALLVDSISTLPALIYLGAFGVPAALLLATALRGLAHGGGISPSACRWRCWASGRRRCCCSRRCPWPAPRAGWSSRCARRSRRAWSIWVWKSRKGW
ncbi:hypothetical protein ACFQU7_12015 [Pseudoroseomonas wenyumeiae]